jgi:hypothetical protein
MADRYDTNALSYAERAIINLLKVDVLRYPILLQYIEAIEAGEHLNRREGRKTIEIPADQLEELLRGAA